MFPLEYLDLATPHQKKQNDRNLQIGLEVKYAREKTINFNLRLELDTTRNELARVRLKMTTDYFVQQNELRVETNGNIMLLQETNENHDLQINNLSEILNKKRRALFQERIDNTRRCEYQQNDLNLLQEANVKLSRKLQETNEQHETKIKNMSDLLNRQRQDLFKERLDNTRLRENWVEDQLVEQLQTKLTKFSELYDIILPKLSEIQETNIQDLMDVSKVEDDIVDLYNLNNSYSYQEEMKIKMRRDLKEVVEKNQAINNLLKSIILEDYQEYVFNE